MAAHLLPYPPTHVAPPATSFSVSPSKWTRVALPALSSPRRRRLPPRLRHATVVRCQKKGTADQPGEPGGPEEGDPHQSPSYQLYRKFQDVIEGLQYCADELRARQSIQMGDMDDTPFNYEINKIGGYWREINSEKIYYLYGQGRTLVMILLLRARDAIGLASAIMTDAPLRAQTQAPSEISLHTVDQTVRTYVSTFVKTAEDTYHRKVDRATILSFLCALQGLASISHILFEDALASVRSIQPDYSPKHDVEAINRYYKQEIKCLINNFGEASTTEELDILHHTVNGLTQKVTSYVTIMITLRKSIPALVPGRTSASCDAAPPDDRQTE
uniref:Uncharacterized protein n=1 Tax=Oryza punctata TaxID=4537 RepID=A0A0E0LPK2_ORYPU